MFQKKTNAERSFILNFEKKAIDYIEMYQAVEEAQEQLKAQFGSRPTEEEYSQLSAEWFQQRDEIVKMFDRATKLAGKYGVPQDYCRLIQHQPGYTGEWGYKPFSEDYAVQLHDSVVRIVAALEHAPPFSERLRSFHASVWRWLDNRGVAKWIVVAIIVLIIFAILRWFGYDLKGLTDLVKAIKN